MVQRAIVADMELHTTTTRQGLGGLLLPWCVDTRDRTCTIRIHDVPDLIPHALQLRVWDVVQEDILIALGRQDAEGDDSLEKIQSIRDAIRPAPRDRRLQSLPSPKWADADGGLPPKLCPISARPAKVRAESGRCRRGLRLGGVRRSEAPSQPS
jgi:hypothetical protein